ncbi:MAG: hypothetical protein AAF546_01330 [Verrucomicrobiota bacterium]
MLSKLFTLGFLVAAFGIFMHAAAANEDEANMAERLAMLELRIAELEARLSETEQETEEVKVLATTASQAPAVSKLSSVAGYNILANSAWRNYRWTEPAQWENIRPGMSISEVDELLGEPPRTVKSLKPRVDLVYFYETSIRNTPGSVRGKISFKDGRVVSAQVPNFEELSSTTP